MSIRAFKRLDREGMLRFGSLLASCTSHPETCGQRSMIMLGKGLHSDGHVAKIKPAIEDLMKK